MESDVSKIIENLEYINKNIPAYINILSKTTFVPENIPYFIQNGIDILKMKLTIEATLAGIMEKWSNRDLSDQEDPFFHDDPFDEYKAFSMDEIDDVARKMAVAWVDGYEDIGMDIPGKVKLAGDFMNYGMLKAKQFGEWLQVNHYMLGILRKSWIKISDAKLSGSPVTYTTNELYLSFLNDKSADNAETEHVKLAIRNKSPDKMAIELVSKFKNLVYPYMDSGMLVNEIDPAIQLMNCIACATIEVEEIISCLSKLESTAISMFLNHEYVNMIQYYRSVLGYIKIVANI